MALTASPNDGLTCLLRPSFSCMSFFSVSSVWLISEPVGVNLLNWKLSQRPVIQSIMDSFSSFSGWFYIIYSFISTACLAQVCGKLRTSNLFRQTLWDCSTWILKKDFILFIKELTGTESLDSWHEQQALKLTLTINVHPIIVLADGSGFWLVVWQHLRQALYWYRTFLFNWKTAVLSFWLNKPQSVANEYLCVEKKTLLNQIMGIK